MIYNSFKFLRKGTQILQRQRHCFGASTDSTSILVGLPNIAEVPLLVWSEHQLDIVGGYSKNGLMLSKELEQALGI
jgi:hypothetical protein